MLSPFAAPATHKIVMGSRDGRRDFSGFRVEFFFGKLFGIHSAMNPYQLGRACLPAGPLRRSFSEASRQGFGSAKLGLTEV